jgi:hypothetical protein
VQQALASLPILDGLLFCLSMAHDGVEDITLPDQAQPTVLLRPLYLGKVDRRGNRLADYVLTDLHQRPDARVLTLLLIDVSRGFSTQMPRWPEPWARLAEH